MLTDPVRYFPSPLSTPSATYDALLAGRAIPLTRIRLCAACATFLQMLHAVETVTACTSALPCTKCGTTH